MSAAAPLPFWAADLLHLWFQRLRPADWWQPSAALDDLLQRRYGEWLRALATIAPARFCRHPAQALAAVLLFDQIPRNIHRGSAGAFATDPLARAICHLALDKGFDRKLPGKRTQFLVMPLLHSEDIADQRLALTLFRQIDNGSAFAFARAHHRMIARFGRFPHRNAVLGRSGSAAEREAIAAGFAW